MSEEVTLPLEDDPRCAECTLPIEEGSVVAFGNNIWHVECFRCCKCNTLVDHDSNLLLLNDGMPICENCSYNCRVCDKKIDDLAIMTGDESYHSECFRCRMCQRKIEDLVFAKTSQGIYCIACHNGRMAKNRKSKNAKITAAIPPKELKEKSLPSVPISQGPPPGAIQNRDSAACAPDVYLNHSTDLVQAAALILGTGNNTTLPSPDRRPPGPPSASLQQSETDTRASTRHASFDFSLSNGQHLDQAASLSIPFILDDNRVSPSRAGELSSRFTSSDDSIVPSQPEARPTTERKMSVRERRRPVEDELRLPITQSSKQTLLSPAPLRSSNTGTEDPTITHADNSSTPSGKYTLFPSQKSETSRSPLYPHNVGTPGIDVQRPQDETASMGPTTPARRANLSTPAVPPRSSDRSTVVRSTAPTTPLPGQKMNDDAENRSGIPTKDSAGAAQLSNRPKSSSFRRTTPPTSGITLTDDATSNAGRAGQSHARNVSFTEIPRLPNNTNDPINNVNLPHMDSSTTKRHIASKSLESSPAYNFIPGSPVTLFENDLSKAFNLSPQAKRNSQQSLPSGATLERSGTITRLANKMMKHRKSVSGSALSPKSPSLFDRKKSLTDDVPEVAALQAALKTKTQRVEYLEHFIAQIDDSKTVEQQLESRKLLLASLENKLVQTDAEHQSYLHHRHRISDVNIPLGEWKAGVVADMDNSLKTVKDTISQEVENLIRQRNDLKFGNEKLVQEKTNLVQEMTVLEQRRNNLTEMHDSMLRQIQQKMEANKDSKANHLEISDSNNTIGSKSPSFINSDNDPRVLNDSVSEAELSTPTIQAFRDGYIEEEDEPIVESATKRMSGERIVDTAAPKKFNLVKKTKKAFRWGKTPSNDVPIGQYISGPTSSYQSISESTMSSSKSSDKLVPKSGGGGMFKRTWQSQQNLSSHVDHRLEDSSTPQRTLFGRDLCLQAKDEGRLVPQIVTSCIKVIESRALDFEGLYRKSGGAGEMKSLIEVFESANSDGDAMTIPSFIDVSAITSVLKQYLRKLPVPLITFDNYEPFIGTSAIPDPSIRVRAVKEVLRDLPDPHYETLKVLLKHLQTVSKFCDKNLMTSKNLAVVLGPSIIWDPIGGKEIQDMHDKNSCIRFCIEHAEEL